MQSKRMLQVRDCQGTLWAFYKQYAGEALASFEGDLSMLELESLPGSTRLETDALKRQTRYPQLDFVVVPLTEENVVALKARLSRRGILGINGAIIHTQIEFAGEALFIAGDNFHDECTSASRSIPVSFLKQLKEVGVLRSYSDD